MSVFVNYNSGTLLKEAISSIPVSEVDAIVVVDNCSTQDLESLAEIDRNPRVHLIRSPENLGFGAGVNLAVASSESTPEDLIWVMNPDTVAEPSAVSELRQALGAGECDVAMPLILDENGLIWFAGGEVRAESARTIHWSFGEPPQSYDRPFPTHLVTGASFMLRRRTWDEIGGFDELMFLYCEDALLSLRTQSLGFVSKVVPTARITHAQGASSGGGESLTYLYYVSRNRFNLVRAVRISPLRLLVGAGGVETLRLVAASLRSPNAQWVRRLIAVITGVTHGIVGRTGPK